MQSIDAFTGVNLLRRVLRPLVQARSLSLSRLLQGRGGSIQLLLARGARVVGCGQTY